MAKKKITAKAENIGNLGKRAEREAMRYSPDLLGKLPNSELAAELAGASDKKSKEYKAAMRNLQRYKRGDRKPPKEAKKKIEKAVKKIVKEKPAKKQKLIPGGTVTAAGVICYSAECRKRQIQVKLSSSAMAEFLDASKEGSQEGEEALFEFYGVPGMYMQSGRVTVEFDQ